MTAGSRAVQGIEERMQGLQEGSLRRHVLESAKLFKTSWIELGRALFEVNRDKHYKAWGYSTFEAYAAREIGIRKQTAFKLVRSYAFLERQEPQILKKEDQAFGPSAENLSLDSVDVLRQAKAKKVLDSQDYARLKSELWERGKDAQEVKKDLTALIRQRSDTDPDEAYEKRRSSTVRRLLGVLKSIRQEAEAAKLLPAPLLKEAAALIHKLEEELAA